ncbi:hypothetical protein [Streptomyces sp. NRRL F-5123]|uniref:hypothetical protein n=1 Tax=Streptomyces sp. NRRL F-5123 TaxID=1463856 RepID=UPI0005BAFB67|nr:hypothetical protein [Streptomyces sp. NRRL F-5123]
MRPTSPRRPLVGVLLAATLLPLLGACGIRSTTVPVDAGPAPSRVSCQAPAPENSPDAVDAAVVQIYLVCGGQTTAVRRTLVVHPQATGRVEQVNELVRQLQRPLLGEETKAGFSTAVPPTLQILGPEPGDPADALRLSQPVGDLPSFALAQIVCTVAGSPLASRGGTLVLGGPEKDQRPREYGCTDDLLTRPDAPGREGTDVT